MSMSRCICCKGTDGSRFMVHGSWFRVHGSCFMVKDDEEPLSPLSPQRERASLRSKTLRKEGSGEKALRRLKAER